MRSLSTVFRLGVLLAATNARADLAPGGCGCTRGERRHYVAAECEGKVDGQACGAPGNICRTFGPHQACVQADEAHAEVHAEDAGVAGMSVPPVWVVAVGLWAVARRRLRQ